MNLTNRKLSLVLLVVVSFFIFPVQKATATVTATKKWGENSNCHYTGVYEDIAYMNSVTTTRATGATVFGRIGEDTRRYRTIIKVNLDALDSFIATSSQITSATLHIKKYPDALPHSTTIGAYQMKKPWIEDTCDYAVPPTSDDAVTWSHQYYNSTPWQTAGCDGSADRSSTLDGTFIWPTGTDKVWRSVNVTAGVKAQFDSGNDYGWLLMTQDEGQAYGKSRYYTKEFATTSDRPYLEITYIPTPKPIRIFDNAIFNAWWPPYDCYISFKYTDPEGDDIKYEIQWDTDPDFGSPYTPLETGFSSSGAEANVTISLDPTDPEQVYYWKVRAYDGSEWSNWSETHSFTMDMELGMSTWPYWYQAAGPQFEQGTKDYVEVVGNTVKLISPYTTGTLTSPPIVYTDLTAESANRNHWDGVKWTKSSAADSIGLQIEYKDGGTWSLVPDSVAGSPVLPGNLNGFFDMGEAFCTVDLSVLSTSTYDSLRMKATFKSYTTKSVGDPTLEMWALGKSGGITYVSPTNKPLLFALSRNKPNPFVGKTEIQYQIPKRTTVNLQVFDIMGRSVVTLLDKAQKPGYYSIQWKGTDKNNSPLPTGVYFLLMKADEFKATQKMVLLR